MSGRPREPLEDLKWKKGHRQICISGAGSGCVRVGQPGPSPQPGAVGSSGKRWPWLPGLGIRAIWLQGCHRVMVKCGQRTRSLRSLILALPSPASWGRPQPLTSRLETELLRPLPGSGWTQRTRTRAWRPGSLCLWSLAGAVALRSRRRWALPQRALGPAA